MRKCKTEVESPGRPGADRTSLLVTNVQFPDGGSQDLVRVFLDVDCDSPAVVTVYRTSQIEKYWIEEP
jgi:hypothetical protein